MQSLAKTRARDFDSKLSSFIGGVSKQQYNAIECGSDESLIRDGEDIRVVKGKQNVSYEIENVPMNLDFACSSKTDKCYEHADSDSVVCLSKSGSKSMTGKLFKQAQDKPVEFSKTNGLNMCMHKEMNEFENGYATIFHSDIEKCDSIYRDALETCIESGSTNCKKQLKKTTSLEKVCETVPDNFRESMASLPYTSEVDLQETKRNMTRKEYDTMLDQKSEWANTRFTENGKAMRPLPCEVLGAPCGSDGNSYYGQCVVIRKDTQPVCRPILNEFDLKDANNWLESFPSIKDKMKNNKECGPEFKDLSICNTFNENGQCIYTIKEYEEKESGSICNNPYYKTSSEFACYHNKQTFSGEVETEDYTYGQKLGHHELKSMCLHKDIGNGVIFLENQLGESVCKVLKNKPSGNLVHDANAVYGSVCIPH